MHMGKVRGMGEGKVLRKENVAGGRESEMRG